MKSCNVLWLGKYNQNWENCLHQHNYFQMIGILNGGGIITIDENRYVIQKEMIYLIPPQALHSVHYGDKRTAPLKMIDVKFSVMDTQLFNNLLELSQSFRLENFSRFSYMFEKMLNESAAKEKFYYNMINVYLYELLIGIIREKLCLVESRVDDVEQVPGNEILHGVNVKNLCTYIYENYSNIISLDDLSMLASINKTTLIRIFKELYGTTPIQYINRIRLQKAEELLVNTNVSISEISEMVGFQSIHYFSRYFKQKKNCTPMEFRMRNRESRYFTF